MSGISHQDGTQANGFLRLPRELRDQIYSLLLTRRAVEVQFIQLETDPWTRSMWDKADRLSGSEDTGPFVQKRKYSILTVSRQISQEALDMLYGSTLFIVSIHGGAHDKLQKFATDNILRIRNLRLVARPMGICYPETLKIDLRLWVPLLTNLNRFCIVAQQPLQAKPYYNAPTLEEAMQEWIVWLEPILQYLARNISSDTIVEIEDNNLVETSKLVQKYFTSGFERVQTATGERIFERGWYSRVKPSHLR